MFKWCWQYFLISLLVSDFRKSVWSVPSISVAVLVQTSFWRICSLFLFPPFKYLWTWRHWIFFPTKIKIGLQCFGVWLSSSQNWTSLGDTSKIKSKRITNNSTWYCIRLLWEHLQCDRYQHLWYLLSTWGGISWTADNFVGSLSIVNLGRHFGTLLELYAPPQISWTNQINCKISTFLHTFP